MSEEGTLHHALMMVRGTADSDINVVYARKWLDRFEPIFDEECELELEARYHDPIIRRRR